MGLHIHMCIYTINTYILYIHIKIILSIYKYIEVPKWGYSQNGWFIIENPTKMDVSFRTPLFTYLYIYICVYIYMCIYIYSYETTNENLICCGSFSDMVPRCPKTENPTSEIPASKKPSTVLAAMEPFRVPVLKTLVSNG